MSCVSPAECQSPIGRPAVQADGSGALEKPNPGTPRLQSATSATKSAQNGHHGRAERRPLSGVEQTSIERCKMSGDDPKRTNARVVRRNETARAAATNFERDQAVRPYPGRRDDGRYAIQQCRDTIRAAASIHPT